MTTGGHWVEWQRTLERRRREEAGRTRTAQHERLRRERQAARESILWEYPEGKVDHLKACRAEVDQLNRDLRTYVQQLENLLVAVLRVDGPVDFEALKDQPNPLSFDPGDLTTPLVAPADGDRPRLAGLQAFSPGAKAKHQAALSVYDRQLADAREQFEAAERDREIALSRAEAGHAEALRVETRRVAAQHAAVDVFRTAYRAGEVGAIVDYCSMVLAASQYPDTFPQQHEVAYVPESRQLVVQLDLPTVDVIPEALEYRYVGTKDEVVAKPLPATRRKALYANVVAQITLRTVHEMFKADRAEHFDTVVFNGHVSTTDPRTGHATRPCLVTLRTTRDAFHDLDLEHVDPEACLRGLNASVSRSPSDLAPVRPVLEFDMVDSRFVESANVLSSIDQRPNLMELKPAEFEQLITNLFEKMGLETRLTQASRDGGVDCVAYDPRPILGGKVVIQAKRYKNTVGVSAVRDLFGTMQNEGASKGILVTTSGYGKASFEFAQGKPLELLSGSNLLALLADYAGITAKIEAPEDWTDPIDDAPEIRQFSAPTQPPEDDAVRDRASGSATTSFGVVGGHPDTPQRPSDARAIGSPEQVRRGAPNPLHEVDEVPRAALITVRVREDTHAFTGHDGDTIWCSGYAPIGDEGEFLRVDDHCSSDPHCFYCKVAGAQHYPALADQRFGRGSQIALVAEPENPHDANAVGVWDITGKQQAGHVSASLCGDIAQLLRSGVALGGLVIREFRATSSIGERIGLHVLIGPVGDLSLVVLDDDE